MTSMGVDSSTGSEFSVSDLEDYWRANTSIALEGRLKVTLINGGRSNLTYHVSDGASAWVLRRPPLGVRVKNAHDMSRECRVMSALSGSNVPVPEVVFACDEVGVLGVPFYVMRLVEGRVLRTPEDTRTLAESERNGLGLAMIDTLADIHDVDYHEVGLGDLGRPAGYLERQIHRWSRQYDLLGKRDLRLVHPIAEALLSTVPKKSSFSLVHGDYRIDNLIVPTENPRTIAAVLDWEMATLGDPLADLATLVSFWDEDGLPFNPITGGAMALPGFPSKAEVIERYADRRGFEVADLDWYLAFVDFRLAVILEQIYARHVDGQTLGEGFLSIGSMVTLLLERVADRLPMN